MRKRGGDLVAARGTDDEKEKRKKKKETFRE
jgi:hypothetical protein